MRWIAVALVVCLMLAALGAVAMGFALAPPRRLPGERNARIVASDGAVLVGVIARPAQPNGDAVLLLHGVADNADGVRAIQDAFVAAGYLVLAPDARMHGGSGGSYASYGVLERDDLQRWVRQLRRTVDLRCVHALGLSMGAAQALQAFADSDDVCAIAAEAPFASFEEIALDRVGQAFGTGRWLGYAFYPALLGAKLRAPFALAAASPQRAVESARVPILFIVGDADDNVRPRHAEALFARTRSEKRMWRVPGAGHVGVFGRDPAAYVREVALTFRSAPATTR